jgi:hypothetical protein
MPLALDIAADDNPFMLSELRVRYSQALAITIFLLLSAPTIKIATAQADDFGFRFEFEPCFPWITVQLDTFNGVFTANTGGEPTRTVTVQMSLTDAQMRTVYRTTEDIRFFDYPATFIGVSPGDQVTIMHPASTYRLEVRNAGAVHTVSWLDNVRGPTTPGADRLRDLFSMVRDFIHEHPEFKRLPRPTIGCE